MSKHGLDQSTYAKHKPEVQNKNNIIKVNRWFNGNSRRLRETLTMMKKIISTNLYDKTLQQITYWYRMEFYELIVSYDYYC